MKKTLLNPEQMLPVKKELEILNKQFDLLIEEIRIERAQGLPSIDEFERQLLNAQKELDRVQKKMDKAKAHIKRRKMEIKQWKESFDRLEQDERVERMPELQAEINWRSEDIAAKEATIAALYIDKTKAQGALQSLEIKEILVKEGYHLKSINEDPRLKAIKEERENLRNQLSKFTGKKSK